MRDVVPILKSVILTEYLITTYLYRYDHYFLRTASYDVPSEAKSAFALEMDDLRVMLRDSTDHSLVMIDELGTGDAVCCVCCFIILYFLLYMAYHTRSNAYKGAFYFIVLRDGLLNPQTFHVGHVLNFFVSIYVTYRERNFSQGW